MTNDINITAATVVAIQGEAISTTTPTDGYALIWNSSGDGYWEPKAIPSGGLRKEYFTSNGSWTCPEGITTVIIVGSGGGSGGGGGATANSTNVDQTTGGAGGAGAIEYTRVVSVTPNTQYSIVIGQGGAGGLGATTSPSGNYGSNGYAGTNTEFKNGATLLFSALGVTVPGTGGSPSTGTSSSWGGSSNNFDTTGRSSTGRTTKTFGYGGDAQSSTNASGLSGGPNVNNLYSGGSGGSNSGANFVGAGSGGGAGPNGNGAIGGTGGSLGAGNNGSAASNNTGAGGGGGSGAKNGFTAGSGGAGGSGYLYIIY